MQERLRPRVAPRELVVAHQVLVKMLRREAAVATAIERLDLHLPIGRHTLAGNLAEPPVQQSGLPILLIALTPTPKRPLANPQQLGCLQLTELRRFIPAQNAQELDHPHTLSGFRPLHPRPQRLGPLPDRSCAT